MSLRLLIGLWAAVSAVPAFGADEVVPDVALRKAGLTQYWQERLPLRRGDSVIALHLLDDSLYALTRLGDVHALDPAVGSWRWMHSVGEEGRPVFRPTHLTTADGQAAVLITRPGGAQISLRGSGEVLAEVSGLWTAGSRAVGDAESLYVGSGDGRIQAVKWYDPMHRQAVRTWSVHVGGPVTVTPILVNQTLYFASQSGKVYACTADWNKTLRWEFAAEAAIAADFVVDESGVYVASLDRSLYRLDATTGSLLWRHRFAQPLQQAPIVCEQTVYQVVPGAGLAALDVESHEVRWTDPAGVAFVSRQADRTCVLLTDDRLAVVESATGKTRETVPLPPHATLTANPHDLGVYLATEDGAVVCFMPRDVRHLRADDVRRGLAAPSTTQPARGGEAETQPADAPGRKPDVDLNDPLRSPSDR